MTNLCMVVAHPDDEIIFGWMVLKEAKKILTCVSDARRKETPERSDGRRRKALEEIGELLKIPVLCMGKDSNFSEKVTDKETERMKSFLEWETRGMDVFTHNEWGEYDHPDHIFLHNVVKSFKKEFYCCDLDARKNRKLPGEGTPCKIDKELATCCRNIYRKHKCFAWTKDFIPEANLYKIKGNGNE